MFSPAAGASDRGLLQNSAKGKWEFELDAATRTRHDGVFFAVVEKAFIIKKHGYPIKKALVSA
jgi:hypothetical protein